MSEIVSITIPIVTVSDMKLPRWMTPFAKHLFGIPTHLTVQERLVLFQTALALPQGFSVVEIGSYLGASTAFLGFAALQRAGFVHAVDPWTNDAMGAEGARDTWAEFRRNTEPFAHFIATAHDDIRKATMNSEEWNLAAVAAGGRTPGVGLFWYPIDPDMKNWA